MTRRHRLESSVLALGALTLLWSLLGARDQLVETVNNHPSVIGAFLVVITVGELFRVPMPSGRIAAPVATGSGIALSLLGPVFGQEAFDVPAGVVTVVVATALGMALVLRSLLGRPAQWYLVAARTVGVAITASLMRVGAADGQDVWAWQPGRQAWLAALVMMAAAAVGLFVDLVLTGLVQSERWEHPAPRPCVTSSVRPRPSPSV